MTSNTPAPDDETREWVRSLFAPGQPTTPKPAKPSKPTTDARPGILAAILNSND